MRISAKSDYAVRAMAELAARHTEPGSARGDTPVKAEELAAAQDIPLKFLLGILRELKRDRLVRSVRGPEGGYLLGRPASEITLADVIRAVDGPLANVRDLSLTDLRYDGAATALRDVWMAIRTSLRNVLETTTLEDLSTGRLPDSVRELADAYRSDRRHATVQ